MADQGTAAEIAAQLGISPAATTLGELYRDSTLGTALVESLAEMIQQGKFGPDLSSMVMQQYDQVGRFSLSSV